MTYKSWLNEWLEDYVKPFNKIRTHERYSQICKLHIIPSLGDYDLTEISACLLQKFVAKLLANGNQKTGNGLSANFVNAVISVLQNSLQTAFRIGLTFEYVANKIKRPKVIEKQVTSFSVSEQKKIEQYNKLNLILCIKSCKWKDYGTTEIRIEPNITTQADTTHSTCTAYGKAKA